MILVINLMQSWIMKSLFILIGIIVFQLVDLQSFMEQDNLVNLFFQITLFSIVYLRDKNEKQQFIQSYFQFQQLTLQQDFIDKLIPSSMIVISRQPPKLSSQNFPHRNSLFMSGMNKRLSDLFENLSLNGNKSIQLNPIINSKKLSGAEMTPQMTWEDINVEFVNQKCQELFKTSELQEIKQKLQTINTYEQAAYSKINNYLDKQNYSSLLDDIIQEISAGQSPLKNELFYPNCGSTSSTQAQSHSQLDFEIVDVMESKQNFIIEKQLFRAKYAICIWSKKPCILVLFIEPLQKKNNHLQQMNQYKDKLLATVSHDLKTPLNCIISVTDYLKTQICQDSIQLTERLLPENNCVSQNFPSETVASVRSNQLSLFSQQKSKVQLLEEQKKDSPPPSNLSSKQDIELVSSTKDYQNLQKGNNQTNESQRKQYLEYLQLIYNNSIMLLNMINDILDYSKFNNKIKIKPNISQFVLSDVIQEVYDIFSFQVQSKQVNLLQDPNNSITLSTDRNRVKQIIMNLVSNSLKFTIQGHVKVSALEIQNQNRIGITIEDTGIGMSDKIKQQLFKDYQTFNQDNLNQNGIGLGLTICKKFVEMLGEGAGFQVESEEGNGSKFYFEILQNYTQSDYQNEYDILHFIRDEFGVESPVKNRENSRYLNNITQSTNLKQNNSLVADQNSNDNTQNNMYNIPDSLANGETNFLSVNRLKVKEGQTISSSINQINNSMDKKGSYIASNLRKVSTEFGQEEDIPTELMQVDSLSSSHAIIQRNIVSHKVQAQQLFKDIIQEQRKKQQQKKKKLNIMIVDDSQYNLITLKLHLKPINFIQVDEFLFAEEALKQFQFKNYDIVFSDVQMPIMDGIQFVQQIRQKGQSIHQPLVVMVSADTQDKYDSEMKDLSISSFINKPIIDKAKFQNLIYSLVDQL